MQQFKVDRSNPFCWHNGAVGFRPGGPFDPLGPYAIVKECPIRGVTFRRAAYATGYAQDAWSVPACTRYKGRYIGGYLKLDDSGPVFVPHERFVNRLKD